MYDLRSVQAGDVGLAAILALVPLLPSGPGYLGLPPASWVELAVVALVFLWVAERWTGGGRGGPDGGRGGGPDRAGLVSLAWMAFATAVLGAAGLGLAADNDLGSPVFLAHLAEAPWQLFRPTDMAAYPLHSLRVGLTFVEGLLVFAIVRDLCRRAPSPRRRARAALVGWLTGLALVAVVAVVQHQTELGLHSYWVRANPELVRSHATFDDPNALGSFLVLGLGLLSGMLLAARERRRQALVGALVVLAVVALWTTKSRAAWGALVLASTLSLALFPAAWLPRPLRDAGRARLAARVGVAVLLLGIAVIAVLRASVPEEPALRDASGQRPRNTLEVIAGTLNPQAPLQNVLKGRLRFWWAATGMFRDHPVAGVGLGRFPRLMSEYRPEARVQENTHNLYLQMAAETGTIGAGLFLLLLAASLWTLALAMRSASRRGPRLLAAGAFAGGLGFFLTMLTGHVLLLPSGQLVWAAALALVLALAEVDRSPGVEAGPKGPTATVEAAPGHLVVALAGVVILLAYGWAASDPPFALSKEPPWGYAWGLYPAETDASGRVFRWTRGRALLDLALPAGARRLELPIAVPRPVGDDRTVVRIRAGDVDHAVSPEGGALEVVSVPLPAGGTPGGSSVMVEIRVSRTYVPAATGASEDARELGVQMFEPRIDASPGSR